MFIAEFNKAAAKVDKQPPVVRSYGDLQKKLRPGDILVATPRPSKSTNPVAKGINNLFGEISKKWQGEYTHSAVYTGKGGVTEIRLGESANTKTLRDALKGLDVKVVRPQVSKVKRDRAVRKLNKMVEEGATYDPRMLLEVGAAKFMRLKGKSLKERLKANKVICSNMVTHAYSGVKFHSKKDQELLMPSDFINSPKVKSVLDFRNPGRRGRPKS